ncbi:MAG: hypothetical protein I8H71_00785 [Xanthomonadaceae bacterium]|nr:hypothetical protein [Xanthomonadaceae bacterium]
MSDVRLFPIWRQAVQDFLAARFDWGSMVSHEWLERAFAMDPIADDAALTAQQFRDRQFVWLQAIEAFKAELLEDHQILLASVRGEGYRVVPPGEQTSLTTEKFESDAKRVYRKAAVRLKNVQVSELSDSQRRENSDAIARLAMLRGMQKTAALTDY